MIFTPALTVFRKKNEFNTRFLARKEQWTILTWTIIAKTKMKMRLRHRFEYTITSYFCIGFRLQNTQNFTVGEKPYKCPICSKTFTQSGSLFKHKAVHEKQPPSAKLKKAVESTGTSLAQSVQMFQQKEIWFSGSVFKGMIHLLPWYDFVMINCPSC